MNLELANVVLTEIETNPTRWEQSVWAVREGSRCRGWRACETAYCFAGHAVVLSGYSIAWCDCGCGAAHGCYAPDSTQLTSIDLAAMQLLDIDEHDADRLFHGHNTLTDIKAILAGLKEDG